jgi:hypothetical protein
MEWSLVAIPALMWSIYRVILPNQKWEFDFDQTNATFTLILNYLVKLTGGLIVMDVALGVFGRLHQVPKGAVDFCVAGAVYGILFLVHTITRYEFYLHVKYPRNGAVGISPYTTASYALTRTLGYSAVLFSVGGMLWTMVSL